jgi:hypothetical protein
MKVITGQDDRCGPWMCAKQGVPWVPGAGTTIGLESSTGELKAVVCFDSYNGVNISMHVAAVPGKHWLNRNFLWYSFYHPFEELQCKRITTVVASCNVEVRRFMDNLGFTLEATLKDAHPAGDLLIYVMYKDQCRWTKHLKERHNGQIFSSSSTRLRSSR